MTSRYPFTVAESLPGGDILLTVLSTSPGWLHVTMWRCSADLVRVTVVLRATVPRG